MDIQVKGKQVDVGDSLRQHIENSVSAISEKYFGNPLDSSVTISRQGQDFRADITVHVGKGIDVQGQGSAVDAYAAFDEAGQHIDTRLRRYKRRIRDHHRNADRSSQQALQYVLQAEDEDNGQDEKQDDQWHPMVVAEMTTSVDNLTVGQAVMRMDLADLPAMMFRNSAHGGLNMVYRRPDGNIGWIDPKDTSQE